MLHFSNYIDGEWVKREASRQDSNPSDTDHAVGEYSVATAGDVSAAISAARAAFRQWSRTTAHMRAEILHRAGAELASRAEEVGVLLSSEEGKPRADGIAETMRAAQILQFFAGETLRLAGEKLPRVRSGVDVEVTREPVGVIGVITPWNFPIAIPAWKIAPAIAFGNTVVFKPADLTPGCAWTLTDILQRAGLPRGVLNLVMGSGSEVGGAIVRGCDAVTFTGSVTTGRQIAETGALRMIRLQLEMGGKNPLVVLDDADLETAVNCALNGAFYQTGQRCTASSRFVVTEGIHDKFVETLTTRMRELKVGHALDPGVQLGPVVDSRQFNSDLRYVELGKSEGARVIGGETLKCRTPGYYLSPALFTETDNRMQINREEIFGPIASVIRVRHYEEALAVSNDTPFGLSAGICTTSLKHARHFQENSETGVVMINLPTAGLDYHAPFGGRKASSFGPREQGRAAAEFFTQTKTTYVSS